VTSPGEVRRVRIFTDGAARGNPGPAGAGAVILDGQGRVLARLGRFLGKQTNNVAEYQGLLLGLRRARQMGAREVEVRADSQLLIRQLQGKYAVKNEVLKRLHEEALALLRSFDQSELVHVPREQNALADEMSNRAIDEQLNDA
jgi:ribonuclease HI